MNQLLIIGGASFDVLHLEDRTVESIGGAGLYTAMAAHRCGVHVTMMSIRPDPCPVTLKPVARNLKEWLGPAVSSTQLPQFEISYRNGKTEYLKVSLGDVAMLTPGMLPDDLSMYDLVHVTQKAAIATQLAFIKECRLRGARKISAGTSPLDALKRPDALRTLLELCDYFFMNDLEAESVFGSLDSAHTEVGKVLFITLGSQGARIIQGDTTTKIPAISTSVIDPTGAGDTFCGATLAYLLRRKHPVMAARHAIPLTAEMITQVGPKALLSGDPPPEVPLDPHVQPNHDQINKVAEKISSLSELSSLKFIGPGYPPVGHPKTLDYFFAATLHQFGFWTTQNGRYHKPLISETGAVKRKGSDYLWAAYTQRVEQEADFCSPKRHAKLNRDELLEVFRSDKGDDPMPALDLHLEEARRYGHDMLALHLTPQKVLERALETSQPLQTFIAVLDQIGGYKEDPLRKKSSLLALILKDRPENFLPLWEDELLAPIIDYHLLRSCLRVGLIDVIDDELKRKLRNRQIVTPAEEWAVRFAAYRAIEETVALSGKSTGAVTLLFFDSRKRCPEMADPVCQLCELDPVCVHRSELFQPVLRTSHY